MNITDCHFHLFGPLDKYPPSETAVYTPADVSTNEYGVLQKALHINRGVIVQASCQGFDNSRILDAVEELGDFRAVVVVPSNIDRKSIEHLHEKGARGIRIISAKPGGLQFSDIPLLVEKIKDLGWHLEFYTEGLDLPQIQKYIEKQTIPIVLGHMGHIPAALTINHPLFQSLFSLCERENIWIKWIPYRCSQKNFPYDDVEPIARKFLEIAPERLVWGTDWPHTNMKNIPKKEDLLHLVYKWTDNDQILIKKILRKNPEILYGFSRDEGENR